jgi:AcrR family transcriptional regulator
MCKLMSMATSPKAASAVADPESSSWKPLSRRGQRTREALVGAALEVFARDGFFDAKITDVTAAAGVANGSFYTYFDSKLDIFHEAAERILTASVGTVRGEPGDAGDPVRDIYWATRGFMLEYQRQAGMMRAIEQTTPFDPRIQELRRRSWEVGLGRTTGLIQQLQQAGLADAAVDAEFTAACLGAMVIRVCYASFVLSEIPVDVDRAVLTATRIWVKAIGLDPAPLDSLTQGTRRTAIPE